MSNKIYFNIQKEALSILRRKSGRPFDLPDSPVIYSQTLLLKRANLVLHAAHTVEKLS